MTADRTPSGSPLRFFLLVFLLSAPVVLLGGLAGAQLLPGLPLSALAVVCPLGAALICAHRDRGMAGARALLARSVDVRRTTRKAWYLPVLLLPPAVLVGSALLLRAGGIDLPAPQVGPGAVLLLLGFLVGGLLEELGWSGYALEALLARCGALAASLLLGAVWALWHLVPLLQVGRSAAWIAWWVVGTVAVRVVMVWLFLGTGRSVAAVALFHALQNLGWQLFPVRGSYYDPRTVAVLTVVVAVVVAIGWGPSSVQDRSPLFPHSPRS